MKQWLVLATKTVLILQNLSKQKSTETTKLFQNAERKRISQQNNNFERTSLSKIGKKVYLQIVLIRFEDDL